MPEPLSEERLAEIRARLENATPGPWEWEGTDGSLSLLKAGEDRMVLAVSRCDSCWKSQGRCWHPVDEDAVFIAHAPEDLAALLAEVDRLRAERKQHNRAATVAQRGVRVPLVDLPAEAWLGKDAEVGE
jgi:hypothetical protein